MILQIFKIRNMAKEAKENPGSFAGSQVGEMFMGILIVPALLALFFTALFFVLGYTTLLGGPFGFFKILFIFSVFCILCLSYFLRKIYKMIKVVTKDVVDSTIKVDSKVVE
jgi:hypothetical protein